MNSKTMKQINRYADYLLLGWLKTLISEEEHSKVNMSNLHSFLPEANYFYADKSIRLSFYSPKWVRKGLKKLVSRGVELHSITMEDIESLAKNEH